MLVNLHPLPGASIAYLQSYNVAPSKPLCGAVIELAMVVSLRSSRTASLPRATGLD